MVLEDEIKIKEVDFVEDKKDMKHLKYVELLNDLSIKELDGFKLGNILYTDIWFGFEMNYIYIIKQTIYRILFEYLHIELFNSNNSDNLLFTYRFNRRDYDEYWANFKNLFSEYQEIEISYNYHEKPKASKSICKNIIDMIHIFKKLKFMEITKSRLWVTLQLFNAIKIKQNIDRLDVNSNSVFTFFDGGFEGNLVSQYFKHKGITTITLQHGQCLYRDKNHDRINQSVILNFISDYCICKGEFAKKQFVKAGFEESRLLPLGNLDFSDGLNEGVITEDEKKVFCVFLDTPSYPFYKYSTQQLIDIANLYCQEYDFTYFIKPHPADKEKAYLKFIDKKYCKEILNSNQSLDEIGTRIDFSIFHASAIYADLLLKYMKAYKLETEIDFDIVLDKFDTFRNIDELHEKNEIWINTDVSKKYAFFKEQNELYSNPYDVKRRYQDFIKSLDD